MRHRIGWRHGAATGAVLLAGVVVAGLARGGSDEGRAVVDPAERLKIEVVQPVEPVFVAGPVMEVGTLVDGFDAGMMPPPQSTQAMDDPAYIDDEPREPGGFFRRFTSAIEQAMPREERSPPPRIRREDRAYGFDEPRPDWRAEREARRARLDQIEAERRAEREMRARDEDARRDRREMRQRMEDRRPHDPYDDEPVG